MEGAGWRREGGVVEGGYKARECGKPFPSESPSISKRVPIQHGAI